MLEGKELSEYLQSNIQLFGTAMLECLEYFENERILTAEEKEPYTTESAKDKIRWLKKFWHNIKQPVKNPYSERAVS